MKNMFFQFIYIIISYIKVYKCHKKARYEIHFDSYN